MNGFQACCDSGAEKIGKRLKVGSLKQPFARIKTKDNEGLILEQSIQERKATELSLDLSGATKKFWLRETGYRCTTHQTEEQRWRIQFRTTLVVVFMEYSDQEVWQAVGQSDQKR